MHIEEDRQSKVNKNIFYCCSQKIRKTNDQDYLSVQVSVICYLNVAVFSELIHHFCLMETQ